MASERPGLAVDVRRRLPGQPPRSSGWNPSGVSGPSAATGPVSPVAYAFVSHLLSANNIGYLSRVDLLDAGSIQPLVLGSNSTYTSVFDETSNRLVVSSSVSVNPQFRSFNPLATASEVNWFVVPDYAGVGGSTFVPGAVARDMAVSSDGRSLYVSVYLLQTSRTLALQTGALFTQGGAVAVLDLATSVVGEPRMSLKPNLPHAPR